MTRKGWFIIPGVQDGDRTLEDQVTALKPALEECKGKSILDMGCAEGLIGLEFMRAGALCCFGIDTVGDHLAVARSQCAGLRMDFMKASVEEFDAHLMPDPFGVGQYDIVLALGVAHKLQQPRIGIELAARMSKDLVLLRRGLRQVNGVISSKFFKGTVDSHALLRYLGFDLDMVVDGPPPHCEAVEYWRRRT